MAILWDTQVEWAPVWLLCPACFMPGGHGKGLLRHRFLLPAPTEGNYLHYPNPQYSPLYRTGLDTGGQDFGGSEVPVMSLAQRANPEHPLPCSEAFPRHVDYHAKQSTVQISSLRHSGSSQGQASPWEVQLTP